MENVKPLPLVVALLALVATTASGCSTRPREFRAQLAQPAAVPANFDRDMRFRQVLVRRGVKKDSAGSAAQVALLAGSLGTTFSSSIGLGASGMFVAGPLVGFGVSQVIRSGRERKYRAALTTCMAEYGYSVAGWERQQRLTKPEVEAPLTQIRDDKTSSPGKTE
jgi:hypothetical protein